MQHSLVANTVAAGSDDEPTDSHCALGRGSAWYLLPECSYCQRGTALAVALQLDGDDHVSVTRTQRRLSAVRFDGGSDAARDGCNISSTVGNTVGKDRPTPNAGGLCYTVSLCVSTMPEEGLEPSRDCSHRILSPARLPVPPLRLERQGCKLRYASVAATRRRGPDPERRSDAASITCLAYGHLAR